MADSPLAVLKDDPFPELFGPPNEVALSADGRWIAATSVTSSSSTLALYRAADLSCAHLLVFTMEAGSIAFHPVLPVLAIGCDNGDEYDRNGSLTLFEPDTGHRVDFPDPGCGIEPVRWLDGRTLEMDLFSYGPGDAHGGDPLYARCRIERDDWLGLTPGAIDLAALPRRPYDPWADDREPPPPGPSPRTLAAAAGRSWDGRGRVLDVAALSDGRVLAVRTGTALECWAPDGSPLWSVPSPSPAGGARIALAADERTARVAVPGEDARKRTDFPLIDTADGAVLGRCSVDFSAALSARTDGTWAVRDTYNRSIGSEDPTPPNTRVFTHEGTPLGSFHAPDRYDMTPLDVRRCPELLYGRRDTVVALAHDGTPAPLFTVDRALGPAVYVHDSAGPALLHGHKQLVRRAFPSGAPGWSRPLDSPAAALDTHAGVLHVVCEDGTLLAVDALDGTVLRRCLIPPYAPLSLSAAPDGTVLIGTLAGQILRY